MFELSRRHHITARRTQVEVSGRQPSMAKDSGEGEPVARTLVLDLVDGVLVPPRSFRRDVLRDALLYEARPDDIFLATYPKTGATWTQYTLWFLLNLDNDKQSLIPTFSDIITKHSPFLELVGRKVVEATPSPRVIKHHLTFTMSPYHPKAKYVTIVRNPFDCVVSFYHHCMGDRVNLGMREDTTFDEFFEDFMDGHVLFGHYFEHVLSWYAHRNDPNVFFFYYERFKSDPKKTVLALAKFIDESIWQKLRTNKALLNGLLERISFVNLKSGVKIEGDVHHKLTNHDGHDGKGNETTDEKKGTGKASDGNDPAKCTETPEKEEMVALANFFRKGEVGDWKSYLKPEQEKRLREVYEKRMRGTEMWDVWKDYLGYND
ncbi:sulfotransferase 1C2 isoform X2 [Rhipicephalus microplus]|uniref:sulfotransferase 1C2 isoform X2 n=1 Tax=Rhipicephalus microplus TaxID=6941 RepID=UPI003F6C3DE6